MIVCKCPVCSKEYKVRDELAGKSGKCACGNRFMIPAADGAMRPVNEPVKAVEAVPVEQPTVAAPMEVEAVMAEPEKAVEAPSQEQAVTRESPVQQPETRATIELPAFVMPKAVERPVRAAAPAGAPKAAVADEGYGGVGRVTFVLALVGVTVVACILGILARHSGMGMRMVAGIWGLLSVMIMFIVSQARLINTGHNEWLALLLGVPIANIWLIGGCSVFAEGYGDKRKARLEGRKSSVSVMAGAIAVGIVFYAVVGAFGLWLVYWR
jgi:uncharacterized membrane protein YhaH (DUF805 family)